MYGNLSKSFQAHSHVTVRRGQASAPPKFLDPAYAETVWPTASEVNKDWTCKDKDKD